ncbi:MAG: DNA starvation/stationary phase protection protein [Oscillospiraceae bacterium]|nr:DNA starvation/stationary phase protection protein [Oscillospiraceae bacterium]
MKKELSLNMNRYLANIGVNYIKLHNLHWNVVGKNFKSVHEYLESLYDGLANSLDKVAELLKMHGEVPAASMKEYLELASIEELPSVELHFDEILAVVLKDLQLMKAQAEEIRKMADEDDVYDIVGAMEDDLGEYNKAIWFLKAMLK